MTFAASMQDKNLHCSGARILPPALPTLHTPLEQCHSRLPCDPPSPQERVLAEVDAFGRCRDVTHADLQGDAAFPYLQATLKETMRM